jgi:hypothetical protein
MKIKNREMLMSLYHILPSDYHPVHCFVPEYAGSQLSFPIDYAIWSLFFVMNTEHSKSVRHRRMRERPWTAMMVFYVSICGAVCDECSVFTCPNESSTVFVSIQERNEGVGANLIFLLSVGAVLTFEGSPHYLRVVHRSLILGWNFAGIHESRMNSIDTHGVNILDFYELLFKSRQNIRSPPYFDKMKGFLIEKEIYSEEIHNYVGQHSLLLKITGPIFPRRNFLTPTYISQLHHDSKFKIANFLSNIGRVMPTSDDIVVVAHVRLGDLIGNNEKRRYAYIQARTA